MGKCREGACEANGFVETANNRSLSFSEPVETGFELEQMGSTEFLHHSHLENPEG